MNVNGITDDREKDAIRKAICEEAANLPVIVNDTKQLGVLSCAICRSQYLIDQFAAEAGSTRFVPGYGFNDIFHRERAEDHIHRDFRRRETSDFS